MRSQIHKTKMGSFRRMAHFFRPHSPQGPSAILSAVTSSQRRISKNCPNHTRSEVRCPVQLSLCDTQASLSSEALAKEDSPPRSGYPIIETTELGMEIELKEK